MPTRWRICAAAILITGSISSTSGADEAAAACAAPPPADAGAAIGGLQPASAGPIAYREQVYHPALTAPEVSAGVLGITAGGKLLRDQTLPRREISEVGQDFLTLREAPDGPENLIPIPAEAKPMFAALRNAIAGDAAAIARDFALAMEIGPGGWRVRLTPKDPDAPALAVVLAGCGAVLRGIEIDEPGGVRRVMSLEWQP